MGVKNWRSLAACAALGLSVCLARPLLAQHGPTGPWPVFTFTEHPDFPFADFLAGKLGVVLPTYDTSFLCVAYLYLRGRTLGAQQRKGVLEVWEGEVNPVLKQERDTSPQPYLQAWLRERAQVPGVGPVPILEAYGPGIVRSYYFQGGYYSYFNCLSDGFRNAASTLAERIKQFGAGSPEIKKWIASQDRVFANCSGSPSSAFLPAPARPDEPALIQADRAYQLASAYFYAGEFDRAIEQFRSIAADTKSPWHVLAPYLVARALVRKATLDQSGEKQLGTLAEAEAQLKRVLGSNSLEAVYPAARRLLGLVEARLHPAERLLELGRMISQPLPRADFGQHLTDYGLLLSRLENPSVLFGPGYKEQLAAAQARGRIELLHSAARDDLTDWIVTFRATGAEAFRHSLERWEATGSPVWLVAALAEAQSGQPGVSRLLAAAKNVAPGWPAGATVEFYRLRLLTDMGRKEEARAELDSFLARTRRRLPPSSLNLFLALRMRLAHNLLEFLRLAPRTPSHLMYLDEWNTFLPELMERPSRGLLKQAKQGLFDADSSVALTTGTPVSLLVRAAKSPILPVELRTRVCVAAWTRAVLLGKDREALQITPELELLRPETISFLEAYRSAAGTNNRHFAAVFAILHFPGMRPFITGGWGRLTPFAKINQYRDNWWQGGSGPQWQQLDGSELSQPLRAVYDQGQTPRPWFLSGGKRFAAAAEYAETLAVGTAPDYLAEEVLAWAKGHPKDPRVPEALHLAVRATRYGMTDRQTGALSRAAFELLHRKYPKSPWTRKTRYWFSM
jgi:tetratricopeptide (TPR) repeat protein